MPCPLNPLSQKTTIYEVFFNVPKKTCLAQIPETHKNSSCRCFLSRFPPQFLGLGEQKGGSGSICELIVLVSCSEAEFPDGGGGGGEGNVDDDDDIA